MSDIKKRAKEAFNLLKLPPNDSATDLAWYWFKKGFVASAGQVDSSTTHVYPRISEAVFEGLTPDGPNVPYWPGIDTNNLDVVMTGLGHHGVAITQEEAVYEYNVTGLETPLEIWELSERIKKDRNEKQD